MSNRIIAVLAVAAMATVFSSAALAGGGSAVPSQAPAVVATGSAASPAPAPHIAPFAGRLSAGQPDGAQPRGERPPRSVPMRDGSDGCDRAYGTAGQCVPWQFPPGTGDKCVWLREHAYDPLPVHGRDRHQLDRNRDGIACGLGD